MSDGCGRLLAGELTVLGYAVEYPPVGVYLDVSRAVVILTDWGRRGGRDRDIGKPQASGEVLGARGPITR